jgi:transposase-like protein
MKIIPQERRDAIIAKMTGPQRKSIAELAKEENISSTTLYSWRKEARSKGEIMPDHDDAPDGWSAVDKFNAVLKSASLSEQELSVYCRSQGLYPEQIARWKEACQEANDWDASRKTKQNQQLRIEKKKNNKLEKELLRKDKALAETAALLVLSKKVSEIWGDEDA